MAVTMADITKLRQMSGAGMMDCKKALEEAGRRYMVRKWLLKADIRLLFR